MKNSELSSSRIERIGNHLLELPISLTVISVDLSNSKLAEIVGLYQEYGDLLRERHRGVRGRPINQIIYQQVINHAIFWSTQKEIECNPGNTNFSVFLDNWAFSRADVNIALGLTRESMQLRTNEILAEYFEGVYVTFDEITLLEVDSRDKRFIDVVASAVSRSYLPSTSERFSDRMYDIIHCDIHPKLYVEDITQTTIEFLNTVMDSTARAGGPGAS